jgi:hypothetical protein
MHQRIMKLSTEIFRADRQRALRGSRCIPRQPRAPCSRGPGDLKGRRRVVRSSSTQSRSRAGSDRRSHAVLTRPSTRSPALGRRRPSACAGQDRHQWRSVTHGGVSGLRQHGLSALSHPIFVADQPARNLGLACSTSVPDDPRVASRPAAGRPANSLWDFGRSHAAAVKGRFAGLRPPLMTAADHVLETPVPVLRITHVTPAP